MIKENQITVSESTENISDTISNINSDSNSSNYFEKEKWDDEEDTTYENGLGDNEEYKEYLNEFYKSENQINKSKDPNLIYDIDFLHSVLIHRYDREIQRMQSLKSKAIFILTALGFIITVGTSIICADWFYSSILPKFNLISLIIIALIVVLALFSGIPAWRSLYEIDKGDENGIAFCWDYPDDDTINQCKSTKPEIFVNKRVLCRTLSDTINHNYENNKSVENKLYKSLNWLLITFICSIAAIILIIWI